MSNLLDDLEEMRARLDAAIAWNFGVVGNDPVCNARLNDVWRLELQLKEGNPDEYAEYSDKYY